MAAHEARHTLEAPPMPPAGAPRDLRAQIADEMQRHRATLRAGPRTFHQWVKWIVLGLAGMFAIEGALAGTAVITPIDPWFLNGMRAAGVAFGLALGWMARRQKRQNTRMSAATIAVSICLCTYLFNSIAWRLADWWLFTGSNATWETVHYPLVGISKGRSTLSATVSIDPFDVGDATEIPIPRDQHSQANIYYRRYCVTLQQRRSASGAVEVRTEGAYAWNVQPVEISLCNSDR